MDRPVFATAASWRRFPFRLGVLAVALAVIAWASTGFLPDEGVTLTAAIGVPTAVTVVGFILGFPLLARSDPAIAVTRSAVEVRWAFVQRTYPWNELAEVVVRPRGAGTTALRLVRHDGTAVTVVVRELDVTTTRAMAPTLARYGQRSGTAVYVNR